MSNPIKYIPVIIECPECKCVQGASIELAIPFDIYIHECEKCGFIIMESDWNEVK